MDLFFVPGPRLSHDTHITHENIGLEPLAHLRQLAAQRAAGWLDDDDGDRMYDCQQQLLILKCVYTAIYMGATLTGQL